MIKVYQTISIITDKFKNKYQYFCVICYILYTPCACVLNSGGFLFSLNGRILNFILGSREFLYEKFLANIIAITLIPKLSTCIRVETEC